MKPHAVFHGDRDKEKDGIQNGLFAAWNNVIHLTASVDAPLIRPFASTDSKGTYLWSEPIKRDKIIHHSKKYRRERRNLWKLVEVANRIIKA